MLYEKAAHTDGDSVVLFRGSNVLSAGDIFLTTGYPEQATEIAKEMRPPPVVLTKPFDYRALRREILALLALPPAPRSFAH